jgi:hypothetical protein
MMERLIIIHPLHYFRMRPKLSRRRLAKGIIVGSSGLIAAKRMSGNAAADHGPWTWEGKANVYPYEHHIGVCLEHLQTTYYEDDDTGGTYEYKFYISSDGVSHDGSENEKRDLRRSFIKFKQGECSDTLTTYYTPDQKETGFYPKDGDDDEALEEATKALDEAVSLINPYYAWASGAPSIANNLINILTVESNEEWEKVFRRIYDKSYSEAAHHTKIIIEYDNTCKGDWSQAEQICRCQIGSAIVEFKIIIDDEPYNDPPEADNNGSASSTSVSSPEKHLISPEEMTSQQKERYGASKTKIYELRDPSDWMYDIEQDWVWELRNPPLSVKRTDNE